MLDISTETMLAIEWGIVPLILIGILAYFLVFTPDKKTPGKIKASATSGKFAGLLLFALFILNQKGRALAFTFNMPVYDFNYLIVLGSIVSGVVFSWCFKLIKDRVFIGFYTLLSVALTSAAIYAYLFIENLRSYLIFVTLGVMLGVLIFMIFFPKNPTNERETA